MFCGLFSEVGKFRARLADLGRVRKMFNCVRRRYAKAGLKRSLGAIYSCANHLRKIAKMKKLLKEFPGPKSPDPNRYGSRSHPPRCAAF
jgi:hypothetical protein